MFIRSQIQILIRHNFFHTEYFLLKFSGALELFLKRSIPVRFCSKFLYLVTRNFRNVANFQNLTAMRRKWVTISSIFRVSQKEPGIGDYCAKHLFHPGASKDQCPCVCLSVCLSEILVIFAKGTSVSDRVISASTIFQKSVHGLF